MRFIFLILVFLAGPALALNDDDPLAFYATDNGSVAPPYRLDWSAEIFPNGLIQVTFCKGYEVELPGCAIEAAFVDPAALAAILQATRDSGLLKKPAKPADEVMVGGGMTSGLVNIDGKTVELPSSPRAQDVERVNAVLSAIAAAVPEGLVAKAEAKAKAPPDE